MSPAERFLKAPAHLAPQTLPSLMPALGVPDAIVQHQGHAAIARCVCMGGERLRIAATGALQALASTGQAAARAILDDPDCLAFIRDSLRRSPVAAQIEACALVR